MILRFVNLCLVLLFLFSCSTLNTSRSIQNPEVNNIPESPKISEIKPIPEITEVPKIESIPEIKNKSKDIEIEDKPKKIFKISITDINYTLSQKEKLKETQKLLEIIFNSKEYKEEVLNFTFKGERKFHQNKNMSNESIYDHLMKGAEDLLPEVDNEMDLKVKMYYSIKNTVGYTYPSDLIVNTNSKFHNTYDACDVASNLTHEWTHKMGFSHDMKWNKDRDYSVPYGHNSIIEKLCPLAKTGKLTKLN